MQDWAYMLRIPGGSPRQIRMDRLAEYMREFAQLLGIKNSPVFVGIKDASIGLQAAIPPARRTDVWKRIQTAKAHQDSQPARCLRRIESLLGEDGFNSAEVQDTSAKVIHLITAKRRYEVKGVTIKQHGEVDGVVTGLVGADDTMHLHVRDALSRDIKLVVRDEAMARELLARFRDGHVRLRVHGSWVRTEDGWVPENNRCTVDGYQVLNESSASDVFAQIASTPGNGWCNLPDPMEAWRDLRGIN